MTSVRPTRSVRRLLVHLPNWLGDVIMTTPLLADLHRALAEPTADPTEIHLAVRPAWAPLFRDDYRLAGIHAVERNGRHGGVRGIWRHASELRTIGFDAALLGPPSLRAALVARLAGIPSRVGHRGDGRRLLLQPVVPRGPRGSRHYAGEMRDLGRSLLDLWDVADPGPGESPMPHPDLPGCREWAPTPRSDGRPVWALAPGTTYGEAKTWPLPRMAELVTLVVREAGARVVLLGDAGAGAFAATLCGAGPWSTATDWSAAAEVVDLTGRTDLEQVVRMLKATTVFVGNDSGLMHLAGALGVPTVGVFGSSNPDWTHPLGAHTVAVTAEGFACRPCYRKTCNQPEFCLATVTGREVFGRAEALVAAAADAEDRA